MRLSYKYSFIFVKNIYNLKSLLYKYRAIFRFLGFFLGTYLLLGFFYALYLHYFQQDNHPDFVTELVAKQSSMLLSGFGFAGSVVPDAGMPAMKLLVNNMPVAIIVEGCNAVSIIILFVSFVISLAQDFKKTFLFLFVGMVLIYTVNIIRIALLSFLLYKYPEHTEFLHGVVFPGIIYGMVFLLWVIWIRMIPNFYKNV